MMLDAPETSPLEQNLRFVKVTIRNINSLKIFGKTKNKILLKFWENFLEIRHLFIYVCRCLSINYYKLIRFTYYPNISMIDLISLPYRMRLMSSLMSYSLSPKNNQKRHLRWLDLTQVHILLSQVLNPTRI